MEDIYRMIQEAQAGSKDAKDRLLQENSGLIWSIVKRFYGRAEAEDLYQLGAIGLLKCIDKFDFSYSVKFSTYAVPMIIGEIRRFLRDDGAVKVSRSLKELEARIKKLQEESIKTENRELTVNELSERLQIEQEDILLAMEAGREVESLYAPQGESGEELLDRLSDTRENERMMEQISLKEALSHLTDTERQIILLRYFQDRTQSEIARKIGLSQVQVSRLEKRILGQLKERLK